MTDNQSHSVMQAYASANADGSVSVSGPIRVPSGHTTLIRAGQTGLGT